MRSCDDGDDDHFDLLWDEFESTPGGVPRTVYETPTGVFIVSYLQ